jgi:anti-sigma factor RsiW
MNQPAMDCRRMREATCSFLAGELPAAARGACEAHLAGCDGCRDFLELARRTNCKHVADFLSDYIDDELAGEERAAFERHLELCPRCVDYMRSFEATVRAGREVCGDDCPPIPDELVRAILDSRPRR